MKKPTSTELLVIGASLLILLIALAKMGDVCKVRIDNAGIEINACTP